MFLTPKKFAELVGENYELILDLCKKGSIKSERTEGGHYKIYETELNKFTKCTTDYIAKDEYERIIRENERLRGFIEQLKLLITNCN
jgi:excisionase family DNA binding protein